MQSGEHFTAVVLALHSSTCTIRRQSVYDTADITHLLHGLRVVSPRCLTRDNDAFNSLYTCDRYICSPAIGPCVSEKVAEGVSKSELGVRITGRPQMTSALSIPKRNGKKCVVPALIPIKFLGHPSEGNLLKIFFPRNLSCVEDSIGIKSYCYRAGREVGCILFYWEIMLSPDSTPHNSLSSFCCSLPLGLGSALRLGSRLLNIDILPANSIQVFLMLRK